MSFLGLTHHVSALVNMFQTVSTPCRPLGNHTHNPKEEYFVSICVGASFVYIEKVSAELLMWLQAHIGNQSVILYQLEV